MRKPPSYIRGILRATCQAGIWSLSDKCTRELPNPEKYGWEIVDNSYRPITSEEEVAPDSILNMVMCGCKKGQCNNGHCKCFKNEMSHTSMCSCSENCENDDGTMFVLDNNLEDEELFDDLAN